MEHLVTMTTPVPPGTDAAAVDDMRAREAVRARELAAEGHLLRLWRPPLRPGEWRTLGLFAARDGDDIEGVLRSMPLRVWRTDEAVPLAPLPDGPAERPPPRNSVQEFLTVFTVDGPAGVDATDLGRASTLAAQGYLERLWAMPPAGDGSARLLALWRATDEHELQALLRSQPLIRSRSTDTTPLSPHPSDPITRSG